MSATARPQTNVGMALPWVNMMFDYTDKIAAAIPDELLDWRPTDPSGKWCFSLGEIAMHCADARRMFARQLSGDAREDDYWSEGPGEDGVWPFKPHGSKQAILDSLKSSRSELQPFLERPASSITEITEGTHKAYEQWLKQMREKNKDTSELEARGPANVVRVLMAATVHESGHRGALQTLLRQHGINPAAE
jgi:uncharacterized damage-inducible protein DinB